MDDVAQQLAAALQFHRAQRWREAVALYDAILSVDPQHVDALQLSGVALKNLGALQQARQRLQAAIALRPDHAAAHNNLGLLNMAEGRWAEAIAAFEQALAWRPQYVEARFNLGTAFAHVNRLTDAVHCFQRTLTHQPDFLPALVNSGTALRELGRYDEALAALDRALVLHPQLADAHAERGRVLMKMRRFEGALAAWDFAEKLRPGVSDFEVVAERGLALLETGQFSAALAVVDQVLTHTPANPAAHSNRGNALVQLGRLDESLAAFQTALRLRPEFPEAQLCRGTALLLLGDLAAGWADYERRWDVPALGNQRPGLSAPAWNGEALRGKRIAVYAEQGLGDILQFCRYLPLLVAAGAETTFLVTAKMHRLLGGLNASVALPSRIDVQEPFDFQSPLLSLPRCFGATLANIPAPDRYLSAEQPLVNAWRERIGRHGFRVGIAWQGNPTASLDRGRSLPLRTLAPLASLPGVRLISLQKGAGEEQLAELPAGMVVETLGDNWDQGPDAFVDTAAVMENLDLIVTTDTSIAHLAGALGRPTWVLLKKIPEWRWLLDRADSPWYPTLRLFRQQAQGDWNEVMTRVAEELRRAVERSR